MLRVVCAAVAMADWTAQAMRNGELDVDAHNADVAGYFETVTGFSEVYADDATTDEATDEEAEGDETSEYVAAELPIDASYSSELLYADSDDLYGHSCVNEKDEDSDANCYDAASAMAYGSCSFTFNEDGTEFLTNTTCGKDSETPGSPLNNLWTNCSLVILPDFNDQGVILNPFWCFDPTICGHVMQDGYMSGTSDTADNKRCCSSISAGCVAGESKLWKDYFCQAQYSNQAKCENVGDGSWTGDMEEEDLSEDQKTNKLCQASMAHVNACCC